MREVVEAMAAELEAFGFEHRDFRGVLERTKHGSSLRMRMWRGKRDFIMKAWRIY
jgi:hypothetical protein